MAEEPIQTLHYLTESAVRGFVLPVLPLLEFLFHSPFHDTTVSWTPGRTGQPEETFFIGIFRIKKLLIKTVIIFNDPH